MASKHQNNTVKVPESVIKDIRSLGMAAAIKKAKSGSASKEFVEGVRRFYPEAVKGADGIDSKTAKRATAGAGKNTKKSGPPSPKDAPPKASPSRAAIERRTTSNSDEWRANRARNAPKREMATPRAARAIKESKLGDAFREGTKYDTTPHNNNDKRSLLQKYMDSQGRKSKAGREKDRKEAKTNLDKARQAGAR